MKKVTLLLTVFTFLFTLSTNTQAQTVNEILQQYFENIGSVDKWKTVQSMKISGSVTTQGMTMPMTRYAKRPNMYKVVADIQGKSFIQAFDGEIAWMLNPFMGGETAQKMDDEQTKEMAKEEFEDVFIDYASKGHKVSLEGKEEVDGTETFKIKLVKKGGDEYFYFFDTENYVPIMMRSYAAMGPMKGQAVDTFLSDYQEVNGLMIPFSMEQKIDGQTFMHMSAETVELDVELKDSDFSFPTK